jgi:cyclase
VGQKRKTLTRSKHFEIEEVAEGVYAAIGTAGGAAYSNAGIVDLGDQTLVFDTFQTPGAAQDLKVAAEVLTGRPVGYVVISHCHADHWCGNQVFESHVPILATHATQEQMPPSIGWLQELQADPVLLEQELQGSRERLESESDPRWRVSLELSIRRMGQLQAALPTMEFRFPNLTFEKRLAFEGTRRRADLHVVEPGHTASDAYLLLPEDRVLLMGDLGFFDCQPFMAFCNPGAWRDWLEEAEAFDVETFVPGHGPLGTKVDLVLQRRYIALVEDLVARAVQEGLPVEETMAQALPEPFGAWLQGGIARWEANVQALHQRLTDDASDL